ncbi:MAG TPA: site-2 protease family protein [Gammaproteobacteria bacterium]|nr:site-2 protease family protein [Gammaproteobacteria bacterium]
MKTWITAGIALAITFAAGSWVFVNLMIVTTLLLLPSIVVHELGHAVAATLLRFDVFRIVLGIGPVRFELRLFGYLWEVRRYLRGGLLRCAPVGMRDLRRRYLLVVAAGPAANFVVGAAALAVLATSYSESIASGPAPLTTLVLISFVLGFGNLFPFTTARGHASDGKTLLLGLRGATQWLPTLEAGFHVARFLELRREERTDAALQATMEAAGAHPNSAPLLCNLGIAYLDARRYAEARATFEQALALAHESAEQAVVRNNLAYLFMESGSIDDLPMGAAHSAAAYAVFPWHAAVGATHALYELWSGRAAHAVPIIEAALGDELQPGERKGILYILAMAKLRLGERAAALALASEADALHGDTPWQAAFGRSLATDGREFFDAVAARA